MSLGRRPAGAAGSAGRRRRHLFGEFQQFIATEQTIAIGVELHGVIDKALRIRLSATWTSRAAVTMRRPCTARTATILRRSRGANFFIAQLAIAVLVELQNRRGGIFDFIRIDHAVPIGVERLDQGWRRRPTVVIPITRLPRRRPAGCLPAACGPPCG